MPENESIQDRLKKFISEKGLTPRGFELEMGFANAYVRNIRKGIGSDKIEEIYKKFPDLDIHWLFTGEKIEYNLSEINEPLSEYSIDNRVDNSVPYWNLPVSAGKSVVDIIGSTKPSGYIYGLPGADLAENILPVDGASMEPEVFPNALIGVRKMNNWETLNTERIYLIITHDDRMIKYIEHDEETPEILWCLSPNYPRFKIYKSEIIEIQRVCFVYNPK